MPSALLPSALQHSLRKLPDVGRLGNGVLASAATIDHDGGNITGCRCLDGSSLLLTCSGAIKDSDRTRILLCCSRDQARTKRIEHGGQLEDAANCILVTQRSTVGSSIGSSPPTNLPYHDAAPMPGQPYLIPPAPASDRLPCRVGKRGIGDRAVIGLRGVAVREAVLGGHSEGAEFYLCWYRRGLFVVPALFDGSSPTFLSFGRGMVLWP